MPPPETHHTTPNITPNPTQTHLALCKNSCGADSWETRFPMPRYLRRQGRTRRQSPWASRRWAVGLRRRLVSSAWLGFARQPHLRARPSGVERASGRLSHRRVHQPAEQRHACQVVGHLRLSHWPRMSRVHTAAQPCLGSHPFRRLHQRRKGDQSGVARIENPLTFQFTQPDHFVLHKHPGPWERGCGSA